MRPWTLDQMAEIITRPYPDPASWWPPSPVQTSLEPMDMTSVDQRLGDGLK